MPFQPAHQTSARRPPTRLTQPRIGAIILVLWLTVSILAAMS